MPARLKIHVINETGKTSKFEIDFVEEIGYYVSFLIIESTADCEFYMRFKGIDYVEYPKGLKADVPLVVEIAEPLLMAIKIIPSASADITGWAVTTGVKIE